MELEPFLTPYININQKVLKKKLNIRFKTINTLGRKLREKA